MTLPENGHRDHVRYALRMLWKSPGFAAVAIVTLALGIGANVAIYSVVDAVLINPLPFDQADRLVLIWGVEGGLKSGSNWNSYPEVVDFEERSRVFSDIASFSIPTVTLTGADRAPRDRGDRRTGHRRHGRRGGFARGRIPRVEP